MSFKMKYEITPLYLSKPSQRRSGILMPRVGFVVAHDTGNEGSTAKGNIGYYERSKNEMSASAHIFVDDTGIYECVPLLTDAPEKAWHVLYEKQLDNQVYGDDANDIAGGVEYCFGEGINAEESYRRYIWVMAYICYKFNLDPNKAIVGHMILDPQRKTDPRNGLSHSGRTYEQMLKDVVNEYQECLGGKTVTKYNPQVVKERVYLKNGRLERCDGNYTIKATDVRWIKFDKNKIRTKFVYKKGAKVSELLQKYGADFAINAPFFDFKSGVLYGDVIIDGEHYPNSGGYGRMSKWHEFGKRKNGNLEMNIRLNKDDEWEWLCQAALGLVEGGNLCYEYYRKLQEVSADVANAADTVRAQRQTVGLDKDGNLFIAASDGRTQWDQGFNMKESAMFALDKGCEIAVWFDGGGSVVLADKSGVLNQNKGKDERVTHHALLIYLVDEEEQPIPTPQPEQPKPTPTPSEPNIDNTKIIAELERIKIQFVSEIDKLKGELK